VYLLAHPALPAQDHQDLLNQAAADLLNLPVDVDQMMMTMMSLSTSTLLIYLETTKRYREKVKK
jgi:hypothetical protein